MENRINRQHVLNHLQTMAEQGKHPHIKRSYLGNAIVREWARSAGYKVGKKGPITEEVFLDWVEVFMNEKVHVIKSGFYKKQGVLRRRVTVHCCYCADTHEFDTKAGLRGNLGYRVAKCQPPYHMALDWLTYQIIDNTPMSPWEAANVDVE